MKLSTSLDDTFSCCGTPIWRQWAKLRTFRWLSLKDKLNDMRKSPKTTCEIWIMCYWKSFYGHAYLILILMLWFSSLDAFLFSCQKETTGMGRLHLRAFWVARTSSFSSFLFFLIYLRVTQCVSLKWPDEISKDIWKLPSILKRRSARLKRKDLDFEDRMQRN